ncbi:hypothetical protein KEJ34_07700 [Candidatus Bathyarchaeota archaeon]|nr:hypothetical protein [Candidatus Bathyarchaeota archaeon]
MESIVFAISLDDSAAQRSLNEARVLLEEIPELLERGDVSGAAHNLAEANRLMNEAFKSLKLRLRRKTTGRMER